MVEYLGETQSRVEHWNGQIPKYANNLIPWGWAVKTGTLLAPTSLAVYLLLLVH